MTVALRWIVRERPNSRGTAYVVSLFRETTWVRDQKGGSGKTLYYWRFKRAEDEVLRLNKQLHGN